MIVYTCICGSKLIMDTNSEESRDRKRAWKVKHRKGKMNPGHVYTRNTVRRSTK